MIRTTGTIPGLCGRTRRHPEHTWDTNPETPGHDWFCNGDPSPRSALQIVTDQPALLELRGPGVVIAEAVRSA